MGASRNLRRNAPRSISAVLGIRVAAALLVLLALPLSSLEQNRPSEAQSNQIKTTPLWPGAKYTERDRDTAVERGLRFISGVASNPEYFASFGHDLLFCFYTISNTAKNKELRNLAKDIGRERARQWRIEHPGPPTNSADDLYAFVLGTGNADKFLGDSDPALKERVRQAAQLFSASDFLWFDPRREDPPRNIPVECPQCGFQNARGVKVCKRCRTRLSFRTPYSVWLDALVISYVGEDYGVELGRSYSDVLQCISKMRPYPAPKYGEAKFNDVSYAITHVIYTLNNYHEYRLQPDWLPLEFRYLKARIREAGRYKDGELMGEFLDALRAFGEDENSSEIRRGMNYLLAHQNHDGSWGDLNDEDIYDRYHSTWTAIDGLRQYSYRGIVLRFPEMQNLLQGHTSKPDR